VCIAARLHRRSRRRRRMASHPPHSHAPAGGATYRRARAPAQAQTAPREDACSFDLQSLEWRLRTKQGKDYEQ
jgi:hypothetical protein